MTNRSISVALLLLFCSGFAFAQGSQSAERTPKEPYQYRINDAHCHYVNFVQSTDGMDALFQKMDDARVDNIVLFGLSVTKLWTDFDEERPIYYDDNDAPVYYYGFTDVILAEAIKKLPQKKQERIYPMICGFNPVDKNGVDHIKRMVEMYPDLWAGIGEIFFRHDDLTRMTYGRNPTANCLSMAPVYEFAIEKKLPLWIHSDIGNPIANKPTFLYEMEEALKKYPEATMVWCHVGDTRGVKIDGLDKITRRLLETYKNLYYDISWVVFEQVIAPDGKPAPEWIKIFEAFPDRFMVGTDKIGGFSDYVPSIRKYDILFEALTESTAQKIASGNMHKLLKKR